MAPSGGQAQKNFKSGATICCKKKHLTTRLNVWRNIPSNLKSQTNAYFSESGFQQFIEFGGIGVLRNFCLKLESTDKSWDRLLCRACTVLSQCSVSKPLPLDQESGPLTFALPKECQNIIVDGKEKLNAVWHTKYNPNFPVRMG